MISALVSAPATMARNAGVYITVWGVVLVQTLLVHYLPDALTFAQQSAALSPDTLLGNAASIGLALLAMIVQVTLTLYILANVARITEPRTNKMLTSTTPIPISTLARLAILILLIAGAVLAGAGLLYPLTQGGGIIALFLVLVLVLLVLALFAGLIVFGFAPAYIGHGFTLRESLARSWKLSTTHVLGTIVLFLALLFISGIGTGINDLALAQIENEWIALAVNVTLSALFAFYTATVIAHAIPAAETTDTQPPSTPPRHRRARVSS